MNLPKKDKQFFTMTACWVAWDLWAYILFGEDGLMVANMTWLLGFSLYIIPKIK